MSNPAVPPPGLPRLPSLLRALGYRPFALLWTGQTLSRVGDFLYQIALVWWVAQHTGSPLAMGVVLACALLPMLLFLLLGGVAVDRLPRGRVMLASDLARGVVVLTVAALAGAGRLQLWQVLLASLMFGFVDAFFEPAYAAVVPQLVPAADLPSANALTSLSTQAGRIAGPALGAVLVGLSGTPIAFAIDGASFLVSAACLLPLAGLQAPSASAFAGTASLLHDVRTAVRTVLAQPWLWITIVVMALSNVTLAGPYSVALPFLVRTHLHAGVGLLGLLYAVFPAGYALGSVWTGRQGRLRRRGITAYLGLIVAGLGLLVFGLPVPLALIVVAALANGMALEVAGQVWTSTLQEMVPGDRLGRVSSVDLLGTYILLPVGFAAVGWLTGSIGAAPTFVLGGGATALLAAVALLHPAIRRLD